MSRIQKLEGRREKGQPIVYIWIKKIRPIRSRIEELEVERQLTRLRLWHTQARPLYLMVTVLVGVKGLLLQYVPLPALYSYDHDSHGQHMSLVHVSMQPYCWS